MTPLQTSTVLLLLALSVSGKFFNHGIWVHDKMHEIDSKCRSVFKGILKWGWNVVTDIPNLWRRGLETAFKLSPKIMKTVVKKLVLTVYRDIYHKDHWGSGGPAVLSQISGIPAVVERTLLRSNLSAPSVVGVCCPLLDTVSPDADSNEHWRLEQQVLKTHKPKGPDCWTHW